MELRSDGVHHALERIEQGIVLLSEADGVLGFVKPPPDDHEIRWAGFIEGDAILVLCGGRFHRAATPEDAIAGKFVALAEISADVTMIASAGVHVLAAVPRSGPIFESHDGAKSFQRVNRPRKGPLGGLAVRTDGAEVIAIRMLPPEGFGSIGEKATVFTQLPRAGVRVGPDIVSPSVVTPDDFIHQRGDAILVFAGKEASDKKLVGLDAGGRWIPTDWPDPWLGFATADFTFEPNVEHDRPRISVAPRDESERETGWMMAGGASFLVDDKNACSKAQCLEKRRPVWPTARVFDDGQCDKANGLLETEQWTHTSPDGTDQQYYWRRHRVCDWSHPLTRGATVLLARDRLVKLPTSCRSGWVTGNDRSAFVYCDTDGGAAAALRITDKGVERASSQLPAHLKLLGAEVDGDGTAVSFTSDGVWLCKPARPPSCARIESARIVAARPLRGGRALVARIGQHDELSLEVVGDSNPTRVTVKVLADVVDMDVTAQGHVRLSLRDAGITRDVLVRLDGTLESM